MKDKINAAISKIVTNTTRKKGSGLDTLEDAQHFLRMQFC